MEIGIDPPFSKGEAKLFSLLPVCVIVFAIFSIHFFLFCVPEHFCMKARKCFEHPFYTTYFVAASIGMDIGSMVTQSGIFLDWH